MEKTIKNILVPLNAAATMSRAIEAGILLSKRHRAILHLLKVDPESKLPYPTGRNALLIDMRLRARVAEEQNLSNLSTKIAEEHGITCFYHLQEGSFGKTVASVARDFYCDLIVTRKPAYSLFGVLPGSNPTYELIEQASCPVLTVPDQAPVQTFDSVLFSVWPNASVYKKMDALIPIIREQPTRVTLLGSTIHNNNIAEAALLDKMNKGLRSALRETRANVATETDPGPRTANKIISRAMEKRSNLVVISASIRKGIKDFFVPNYTEQMIRKCPVAVLSVK